MESRSVEETGKSSVRNSGMNSGKLWQDTEEETGQVGDIMHVAIPGAGGTVPLLIPKSGRAVEVIPGQTSTVAANLVNGQMRAGFARSRQPDC